MTNPESRSSETILDGFLTVKKEQLRFPNGYEHDHFTLSLPTSSSVSVIALDKEGRYIINKEYRHAAGGVILSLPGGFLLESEDPCEGGKRELIEETGFTTDDLQIIGSSFPMPGICDQNVIYVFAKGCRKVTEPVLEGSEMIHTVQLTDEELRKQVRSGPPQDGILLAGLCLFDFY